MAMPLLTTKLHTPRAHAQLISRPRLTERLNGGVTGKLTLVSAPAGFGKTTLLSEWAQQSAFPVAWVSLDKGDSDPARFWAYFITALQRSGRLPVGGAALAMLQSPQPPPTEVILTSLINEIAQTSDDSVLVLDDYHLIEAQPIHSALVFLIEHLPPQMHLIIAGRGDPPLPLARLRGRGQLTELREEDLRFTPDEATAFLNQVMGLNLSDEDVAALEARTEGWIVGLQLAALSMRGRDDVGQFVDSFTGSHRYILDYLIEEVFQRQSDDVQDFLLKTSVLDRLTAPLCDTITGRDDSCDMLLTLDHANLFIVPLDESRQWYRYHRLFADLLRHRLDMVCESKRVALLHTRASQWYEASGFPADAVHHALAGHDWERAATLVHDASGSLLEHGEVMTLLGWLQALPGEVVRARPQLCLECSWPLILTGHLEAAESYLAQAEQAASGEQGRTTQEGAAFLGEIVAAQAYIARTRGDADRTIELSQRALTLLPQDNLSSRSIVALNLGLAHWHRGHLAEAERALTEAEHAARRSGNSHVRLVALGVLGPIQAAKGRLHQAAVLCRQAIRLGEQSPAIALAHNELSALLYEWNDLKAAADHLRRGIKLSQRSGNVEVQTGGYRMLARLKQAQGNASAALAALQEAHQLSRDHDVTPFVRARNAACHVEIALAQDDVATAAHWAEQVTEDVDASLFYPFLRLTPVRLLLAQNEKAVAAERLEALYETAVGAGWQFGVVEVRVLQALAAPTPAVAFEFLFDALALAEPEGYVRTFVDKGEPMRLLISGFRFSIERQGYGAESRQLLAYTEKLLAAFDRAKPPGKPQIESRNSEIEDLIEPLSDREREVLDLLADGLTNREIAQSLHVSVNTVKTHLKNIYGKLGVHNRREATAQAKKLGLVA